MMVESHRHGPKLSPLSHAHPFSVPPSLALPERSEDELRFKTPALPGFPSGYRSGHMIQTGEADQSSTPASLAIATQPETELKQASNRFLEQIQSMRRTQVDQTAQQAPHEIADTLQEQENLARDTVRAKQQLADILSDRSRSKSELEAAKAELQQVHEYVLPY
jgi:hypothetical protein